MTDQVVVRPWGNSQGVRTPRFQHKSLQERIDEFGGDISVCDFDWGEPVGRETGDNV